MTDIDKKRRNSLKLMTFSALGLASASAMAAPNVGAMLPGKGWVTASGETCEGDGTPLQFIPKGQPDENPVLNDIQKYPRCPYCGMKRKQWHHSRHLVHYADGLADGTCSIHCLAISLSLNLDRGPQAIYAADYGSEAQPKPLILVDDATYLLGSRLRGTMSQSSKMAFATSSAASRVQQEQGGELVNFDQALKATYLGMAEDTLMIRKRRAEKRKKMMQRKQQG